MFLLMLTVGLALAAYLSVQRTVTVGKVLGEDTNRPPSPSIWGDSRVLEIIEDNRVGFHWYEDFRSVAQLTTPTITTQALYGTGWKAFGTSGGTLLGAGVEGGMGLAAFETDDNEGVNFASLALPFTIARGKGKFWWEARLKISTIVSLDSGFLAGLMNSQTLTAILPITAAGALADVNFVGFQRLESTPTDINTIYKADGVTAVTVKSGILAGCPTTTSLAADTYIKLGMTFNTTGQYRLTFYVNGFPLPDYKAIPAAAGTDFPNDVQMGLVFAMLCGSANDSTFTVDWVRCAQEYAGITG